MAHASNAVEEARSLGRAIRRLSPDRHDPERFFLAREAIAERLETLAFALEAAR